MHECDHHAVTKNLPLSFRRPLTGEKYGPFVPLLRRVRFRELLVPNQPTAVIHPRPQPVRLNDVGTATILCMGNQASVPQYALSGEVSQRAELLNGSMQLTLDGSAILESERWELTISISWRLGREGAVPLEEGDLALEDAGAIISEVVANLESGAAAEDTDTGNAIVKARFTIEESNVPGFDTGEEIICQFEVAAEQWIGTLICATNES
jgi:hypothetical protein